MDKGGIYRSNFCFYIFFAKCTEKVVILNNFLKQTLNISTVNLKPYCAIYKISQKNKKKLLKLLYNKPKWMTLCIVFRQSIICDIGYNFNWNKKLI